MKNLQIVLKILKLLKPLYEKELASNFNFDCYGMCAAVWSRRDHHVEGGLTELEEKIFDDYYKRSKRGQKIFYTCNGFKTLSRNQFAWPAKDIESRLKWITPSYR